MNELVEDPSSDDAFPSAISEPQQCLQPVEEIQLTASVHRRVELCTPPEQRRCKRYKADGDEQSEDDIEDLSQDDGYISSSSSTQHSTHDVFSEDAPDGDDSDTARLTTSRASSRTSISSLPGPTIVVRKPKRESNRSPTPNTSFQDGSHIHLHAAEESGHYSGYGRSVRSFRDREAAFRKPSSVLAMQMRTEDEGDDEYPTPTRRRPDWSSSPGARFAGSSPLKRSPYRSPNEIGSERHRLKKEYPLVLLHCTMLPPRLLLSGDRHIPNHTVLKEILPSRYWRRWKRLEEKVGSGIVRERGVLISHPQETYDLLEERLLESLELQQPRLHNGHFLGHENEQSEKEGIDQEADQPDSNTTDEEPGDECPDCGAWIVKNHHSRRKWEIRVYAANGLMKTGAWAAAWREMEKVDVEIGLWLPSDVRRALEKKMLEEDTASYARDLRAPDYSTKDITFTTTEESPPREQESFQDNVNGLKATRCLSSTAQAPVDTHPEPDRTEEHRHTSAYSTYNTPRTAQDIDIGTLLFNYIRVLASDQRNVAFAVLSILVVIFAINVRPVVSEVRAFPTDFAKESLLTTVVTVTQHHPTTITATATAVQPLQTQTPAESFPLEEPGLSAVEAMFNRNPLDFEAVMSVSRETLHAETFSIRDGDIEVDGVV